MPKADTRTQISADKRDQKLIAQLQWTKISKTNKCERFICSDSLISEVITALSREIKCRLLIVISGTDSTVRTMGE